jgi:Rrf2 family transcriptional regulator, cysteine metabolism repressor
MENMKLSTRSRYGVRAMFTLAERYGQGSVTVKYIADEQDIPLRYLEQLLVKLRRDGLIRSIRGAHGGYLLVKEPKSTRIGEIITCLEDIDQDGKKLNSKKAPAADSSKSSKVSMSVTKLLWKRVREVLMKELDNITLQDLIDEADTLREPEKPPHNFIFNI